MLEELGKQDNSQLLQKQPVNFLEENNSPIRPPKKERRIFVILFITLLAVASIMLFRAIRPSAASNNPYEYDPITLEPKKPENLIQRISNFVFKREPSLEGERNDRINILLLGMGGPGHNGPFLTDTIIIASIKPSTGQIAMISIPRDLGVEMPGYGLQKINHASAYGEAKQVGSGAEASAKIIEDTFDIKIPYYARVDFAAFEEIIDAVGGIKIDVERSFMDKEFPAPNDEYQALTFTKGAQTMDGERALQFARSRHGDNGEGSDFARAARQQKVLLSLKEKILSFQTLANPIRISKIINSLGNHITTNIELSQIIALLKIGRSADMSKIISLVFDENEDGYLTSGYTEDGNYILSPKNGNFKEINSAIKNIFEQDGQIDATPSQDTPAPKSINLSVDENETDIIEIQNGTWQAGLASRIKEKLKQDNINVTEVGNTQTRPFMKSGIYTISGVSNQSIMEAIKSALNIPIQNSLPKGEIVASSTDILIILGEDFIEN